VDRSEQLARFLRARRERLRPEDVGIPRDDRRRVPGLRREELAMLAGVSADYLTRLEQGNGHRPSQQVLASLARALRLDDDATAHLFALSRPASHGTHALSERVRPELQDLLDAWTATPALVLGRRLDVLASNRLARALSLLAEPGKNLVRAVFLDPGVRDRYVDVESLLTITVAHLRARLGGERDDAGIEDLVTELSLESAEFRRLWAQHDVRIALTGETGYRHPVVGGLRLRYQTLAVGGDGQAIFVVHAAPGTRDAETLARLATLAAGRTGPSDAVVLHRTEATR
jgi:transcriptional regulator with XRE-family HTH domain